jgi:DNA-binding transcriptional ArsR family regulator
VDGEAARSSSDGLSSRRVALRITPLPTVTELIYEALGTPLGSPPSWPGRVRHALEPRDLQLLGPVYGPDGPAIVPSCLLPSPDTFESSFEDDLDRLAAMDRDDLRRELIELGADRTGWAKADRQPRRWLSQYLYALRRAWTGARPLWAQAAPLLDREVERVGVALARGTVDQLVQSTFPRGRVEDGRWYTRLDVDHPETVDDELVLQPMIIGPRYALIGRSHGRVSRLTYPLPGASRLELNGGSPGYGSALAALLGTPRATILRRLDDAVVVGQLALDLLYTPGAITHHLAALEHAGLARRERRGRQVIAHRTARGTALLHLYEH